jgi:glycosyltransferase involved in cell wall biosynthesis
MKIGIDATFSPHGGSLVHLQKFVEGFTETVPKLEVVLYIKKENVSLIKKDILEKCVIKVIKIASYGIFSRVLWTQLVFPITLKFDQISVLFSPGNFSPIIKTTKVKSQWIATIGPFCKDMYENNKISTRFSLFINKWIIIFSSFTSNVVIHQAEYSRQLFVKKYYLRPSNQYLIQFGKDDYFKPDLKKIDENNKISNISSNDLLYVSHIFPYKNIQMLIEVFIKFKNRNNTNSKLYIVGKIMDRRHYNLLLRIIDDHNFNDKIIFTGLSSKKDLKYAYSVCKLFTFPSLCESSGYSLIEAMSCGAPILASNKTAIPFTCGDAAEYFNPYNDDEFLSKLEKLYFDNNKLQSLMNKSLDRANEILNYKVATKNYLEIIRPFF